MQQIAGRQKTRRIGWWRQQRGGARRATTWRGQVATCAPTAFARAFVLQILLRVPSPAFVPVFQCGALGATLQPPPLRSVRSRRQRGFESQLAAVPCLSLTLTCRGTLPDFGGFDSDPFAAAAGDGVSEATGADAGFGDFQSVGAGEEFGDFGDTNWAADLQGLDACPGPQGAGKWD